MQSLFSSSLVFINYIVCTETFKHLKSLFGTVRNINISLSSFASVIPNCQCYKLRAVINVIGSISNDCSSNSVRDNMSILDKFINELHKNLFCTPRRSFSKSKALSYLGVDNVLGDRHSTFVITSCHCGPSTCHSSCVIL